MRRFRDGNQHRIAMAVTTAVLLAILAGALLVGNALAMTSTNYILDWLLPLNGGGGKSASDAYAVQFIYGQTGIIGMSGDANAVDLGFWSGIGPPEWLVYLPILNR